MNERHHALREEFVKGFADFKGKKDIIHTFFNEALIFFYTVDRPYSYYASSPSKRLLSIMDMNEADYNKDSELNTYQLRLAFGKTAEANHERGLLRMAYALLEDGCRSYYKKVWNRGYYDFEYKPDETLDLIYFFLKMLGYEMSKEEEQMMNGDHPSISSEE